MNTLHALLARVPSRLRAEAGHVALTFAVAFAAVAAPALPALTHSPDLATAKALIVATLAGALAAGARAVRPLAARYALEWLLRLRSATRRKQQPVKP